MCWCRTPSSGPATLRSPADLPPRDRSQGGVETGLFNSHSFSVTDLCLGKAELRPETRGCFLQGGTEERGGAPPGPSGPSPPHALPFSNFPCVQSIFRGWISISYSFSSGGDFETQEKWGSAWGRHRERVSSVHKASPSPRPWGDGGRPWGPRARRPPGLPGPRGRPRVGARLLSCGHRRPLQGGLCGSCRPQGAGRLHWAVSSPESGLAARL